MGKVTGVEWCDHTYNPWMGCTKVSPACDHGYAEAQEEARYGRVEWGGPRRRTSDETRRAPYRWDREAAAAGERRRVFCMSLGDLPEVECTEGDDPAWARYLLRLGSDLIDTSYHVDRER
jgi:protein gp37